MLRTPSTPLLSHHTPSPSPLSSQILETIFQQLPAPDLARCALVCRTWRALSETSFLWRGITGISEDDLRAAAVPPGGFSPDALPPETARVLRWVRVHGVDLADAARAFRAMASPKPSILKALHAARARVANNWRLGRFRARSVAQHQGTVEVVRLVETRALGDVVVSGGWDGKVLLVSRESGRVLRTYSAHEGWITCMAVGRAVMASGSTGGSVRIWDLGVPGMPIAITQYLHTGERVWR